MLDVAARPPGHPLYPGPTSRALVGVGLVVLVAASILPRHVPVLLAIATYIASLSMIVSAVSYRLLMPRRPQRMLRRPSEVCRPNPSTFISDPSLLLASCRSVRASRVELTGYCWAPSGISNCRSRWRPRITTSWPLDTHAEATEKILTSDSEWFQLVRISWSERR
jgi:hypothetical protein